MSVDVSLNGSTHIFDFFALNFLEVRWHTRAIIGREGGRRPICQIFHAGGDDDGLTVVP